MFDRFRSRDSAITFDVGSTGVRACQLHARGRHVQVRDLLRIEVTAAAPSAASEEPSQAAAGPPPLDPCEARLARMVAQGSFTGGDVAVVLPAPETRFHALRLPEGVFAQPEENVRAALAFEAAREARCEPGELEVRHWPLPPGHQQGLNVMAVSLPAQRALRWFDAFARQRLNLRRLDVSPCALVRLALQSWSPGPRELWAIFEFGHRKSALTVVVGTQPAYVRCLPASMEQWTRRIADAFDLPCADAEQLKRRHGIYPDDRSTPTPHGDLAAVGDDELPGVLFGILRGPLESLVREIDLCCSYVMRSYTDLSVARLVLAGGGSAMRGLTEYLALHLGIPVVSINGLSGDLRASGDAAAAMGAALLDLEAS